MYKQINNNNNKWLTKSILGKTLNEALQIYSNLRIVKNNNKNEIITMDFCEDRCNIIIKNDRIIDIDGFY